ncbi:AAA family ATPase, partial [Salinibacter ruber]|uniref:AAA family ATPase n=1 Tax=Salinibacter ruber TaxID=146919 RepID=UPI00207410E5
MSSQSMPTPGSEEFYQWFESLEPGTPQYRKALRALAEANEGGDGRAGPPPRKPAASHPPSWYERDPTGYPDGESGDDEFDLEDFQIESVPELLSKDIRPPEPLITYDGRSLLHEGTSQLAAKPKIGKTNLVMNFGLAIASESGRALGKAEVQRHGRVLMLNLDGSRRGSYDRFQTMTANDPDGAPERF